MANEKRDQRSAIEKELESIRDVVRALKRVDSDVAQIRVISAAFAHLKNARTTDVHVDVFHQTGYRWEPTK